jgi:hypothetical protein
VGTYTRKVRFEYYRVTYREKGDPENIPDRLFDLRRWFDKAGNLSLLARTYDYYQEQARIDRFYFHSELGYWFLHFIRLRDTNLPSFATTETEAEPIELDEDEYIGEDVSALYDDSLHVLMLQRNRYSLSPTGIEKYLNLLWNSETETIHLRAIIDNNSIKRAMSAKYYRRFTVRFADLRKATFEGSSPISKIIENFGEYNAVQGEISINLGHATRSDTLSPKAVRESIDEIVRNKDIITKAELGKKDDDDTKVELIDLFDEKIHDISYVTLEKRRSLTHNDLVFKMFQLYKDRRQEIASLIVHSK